MNRLQSIAVAALVGLSPAVSSDVLAQEESSYSRGEVSLAGGFQVLNQNDTGLADRFIDVPLVATYGYRLSPRWALEGEFTWLVPVKQDVDLGTGAKQERKTPDILAYQANLRADLPVATAWSPYLAAGAGALTVLSNTGPDRLPQLDESETMFALDFGGGLKWGLNPRWTIRGDFRELVAFPSDQASGLSAGGSADPLWMERATVGVGYRF